MVCTAWQNNNVLNIDKSQWLLSQIMINKIQKIIEVEDRIIVYALGAQCLGTCFNKDFVSFIQAQAYDSGIIVFLKFNISSINLFCK